MIYLLKVLSYPPWLEFMFDIEKSKNKVTIEFLINIFKKIKMWFRIKKYFDKLL